MRRRREGYGKGKKAPWGRQRKKVEKVGGEEKCGKERVKSLGNSSCCPSTLLLLQVNYEFLLFGFPDAHSSASVSNASMFLSGGLSSIPVWIEGIEGIETKTFTCVYLFEDGLSVFIAHVQEMEK